MRISSRFSSRFIHASVVPAFASLTFVSLALFPVAAHAQQTDCFTAAAAYQHVSPLVLRAIAWQESHANARAIHHNANGSTDYGMMQINSIHLRVLSHYGISVDDLYTPCKNIFIAAWYLRRMTVKYGYTWTAVGAYHSETPAERDRYARAIQQIVARLQQLRPDDDPS
ncbi:lytic transglycosylase domain-containing protein [Paraburkholderia sp.]|uniref:lytic transglycosylase domain-containing protein n=1 Tax=Paraburkholderia sp. TaxID=1926495 RepID=UPI003D6ECABD